MEQLIFIYGLSGSGKSMSARILEDAGVRVLRNFPTSLLREVMRNSQGLGEIRTAIFPELSSEEDVINVIECAKKLIREDCCVSEIFLDASEEVLLNRYKESRRPHPGGGIGLCLRDAIRAERALLRPLRYRAPFAIQTDNLDSAQLSRVLLKNAGVLSEPKLSLSFLSFGFKFGVPLEVDLCFDVRFLQNPYFVDELKEMTGAQERVKEFVLGTNEAILFIEKLEQLLDFLLPLYIREGKSYLTIGIGCTGGRHRSVVIADELLRRSQMKNISGISIHRDVQRRASSQNMNRIQDGFKQFEAVKSELICDH